MMKSTFDPDSDLGRLKINLQSSDKQVAEQALAELMESEELLEELMRVTKRPRAELMLLLL